MDNISEMIKRLTVLVFISLLLVACVTTTDSAFTRKADSVEAVEKYVQLGLEYIKRQDYTRARKHLKRALELDEENAPALGAFGLIYHDDGEGELAEASFKRALDIDPDFTRGRTYYGAFLFSEGRHKEALAQFTRAAKDVAYAGRAQIYTNIALCNLKLGNTKPAIEAYVKTLKLDRLNGRALAGITELYIEEGAFDLANKYYNRLVRLVASQGIRHTPQSLWQGIRISMHFGGGQQAESFGNLLKELYPQSSEYRQYQALLGNG